MYFVDFCKLDVQKLRKNKQNSVNINLNNSIVKIWNVILLKNLLNIAILYRYYFITVCCNRDVILGNCRAQHVFSLISLMKNRSK